MTLRSSPGAALVALLLAASALPLRPADAARLVSQALASAFTGQRPVPALWPDAHDNPRN